MVFLLFVLVASAIGIAIVLVRNRRPTSMEASISDFERTLGALAPESPPSGPPPPGHDEAETDRAERGARRPG